MDDIATQKLNELRERASKDFSKKEIDDFIKMGKTLASKPVLTALIHLVEEGPARGYDADTARELAAEIKSIMPYNYCGFVQCAFKEFPIKINVSLSIVGRDYKTDIMIPPGYEHDLLTKYNFIKGVAVAYWKQFCEEHPDLLKNIAEYRSDVDFSQLTVDKENPTVIYFDPECAKRIGIFCYYVDQHDRPYIKKPSGVKN